MGAKLALSNLQQALKTCGWVTVDVYAGDKALGITHRWAFEEYRLRLRNNKTLEVFGPGVIPLTDSVMDDLAEITALFKKDFETPERPSTFVTVEVPIKPAYTVQDKRAPDYEKTLMGHTIQWVYRNGERYGFIWHDPSRHGLIVFRGNPHPISSISESIPDALRALENYRDDNIFPANDLDRYAVELIESGTNIFEVHTGKELIGKVCFNKTNTRLEHWCFIDTENWVSSFSNNRHEAQVFGSRIDAIQGLVTHHVMKKREKDFVQTRLKDLGIHE